MMDAPLNVFINTGLDDYLAKSFNKTGLVQVLTTVQGRHGTYQRMQWVKPGEATPALEHAWINPRVTREDGRVTKPLFFPVSDSGKPTTKPLTAKQVVEQYERHGGGTDLTTFTQRNYFVSDGLTATREYYKRHGEYTRPRQFLHKQIIDKIVSEGGKPKEGEKPVCILLGGGTASGKSTIRDAFIEPGLKESDTKVATVDSDDIKGSIPEYEHFQKQRMKSAAFRVHNESADITSDAIDRLISEGRHFIYDGTMKSKEKYTGLITKLKEVGYEVRVVAATIPTEMAKARSADRAAKTGREVPNSIIESTHGGCSLTYPEIIGMVDSYELWDNSGDEPVLVQDNDGIHDQGRYDAFIQKGKDYQRKRAEAAQRSGGRRHVS